MNYKKLVLVGFISAFVAVLTSIVVLLGGVVAFAYFKYDINTFSLIGSVNKVGKFDSNNLTLSNAFSAGDLESANAKIDAHDFTENYIYFTDKEVAAIIDDNLKNDSSINLKHDVDFLELTFSDYENYDDKLIVRLNFTLTINAKEFKDELDDFPASIISSKIPDTIYLFAIADLLEGTNGNTDYSVKYSSAQVNNLSVKETENLFRTIALFEDDFILSNVVEEVAEVIADGIIGKTERSSCYENCSHLRKRKHLPAFWPHPAV